MECMAGVSGRPGARKQIEFRLALSYDPKKAIWVPTQAPPNRIALQFSELALVLVRFDNIASVIEMRKWGHVEILCDPILG